VYEEVKFIGTFDRVSDGCLYWIDVGGCIVVCDQSGMPDFCKCADDVNKVEFFFLLPVPLACGIATGRTIASLHLEDY